MGNLNSFHFTLDGSPDGSYIKSVEGGLLKGSVIDERTGPDALQYKHLGPVEPEPITLELGMAISEPVLWWIRQSWRRSFERKSGAIFFGDFALRGPIAPRKQTVQSFTNGLITETAFPALNAAEAVAPYLKVKIQPETVGLESVSARYWPLSDNGRQKEWTTSRFQLALDGMNCRHVNQIDSFSVTQKIKAFYVGSQRLPEYEPTGIQFGNISVYVDLEHGKSFLDWYEKSLAVGAKDPSQEKNGHIEYHASDGTPLFRVTLKRAGIFNFTIEKSSADSANRRRCKVELFVESMELESMGGFQSLHHNPRRR